MLLQINNARKIGGTQCTLFYRFILKTKEDMVSKDLTDCSMSNIR